MLIISTSEEVQTGYRLRTGFVIISDFINIEDISIMCVKFITPHKTSLNISSVSIKKAIKSTPNIILTN